MIARTWPLLLGLALGACREDAPRVTPMPVAPPRDASVDAPSQRDMVAQAGECLVARTMAEARVEGWRAPSLRETVNLHARVKLPGQREVIARLARAVLEEETLRTSPLVLSQVAIALAELGSTHAARTMAERVLELPSEDGDVLDAWHRDALMLLAWTGDPTRATQLAARDPAALAAVAIGRVRARAIPDAQALLRDLPAREQPVIDVVEAFAWTGDLASADRELRRFAPNDRDFFTPHVLEILVRTDHPAATSRLDAAIATASAATRAGDHIAALARWRALVELRSRIVDGTAAQLNHELFTWEYNRERKPDMRRVIENMVHSLQPSTALAELESLLAIRAEHDPAVDPLLLQVWMVLLERPYEAAARELLRLACVQP